MADDNVVLLPMPGSLEPKQTSRTLAMAVTQYFYQIFNGDPETRRLLQSVYGNDSVTGKVSFDRCKFCIAVKVVAREHGDSLTVAAKEDLIWKIISRLLHKHDMGLKLRRAQYAALTHQAAAE